MEFLFGNDGSLFGLVGSVAVMFAGFIANKYIIPFLKIGKRERYAALITTLADEITDELCEKYPDKQWLSYLDQAVNKLKELCDIPDEIARRAIKAAFSRSKNK